MATNLLVTPDTRVASLVKLATESHGIPLAAAFWLRRSDADYPSIALVVPLADQLGTREIYGRVMAALDEETFAAKSFLRSRLAVFGERESKEALSALRDHRSLVSKIDHFRNVEIEEIPEAADVRQNLLIDFIPEGSATTPCKIVYSPLGYNGASDFRNIEKQSELSEILQALLEASAAQERILKSLEQGRSCETVVTDIGLDTLYRLKLV